MLKFFKVPFFILHFSHYTLITFAMFSVILLSMLVILNNKIKYIHIDSDHPPWIINHIPKSIAARLSSLSSSKEVFLKEAQSYENTLQVADIKKKLMQSVNNQKEIKTHKRNRWFNPHYCKIVKTNIGKCFFYLINKYFPLEHKLHKILK